MVAKQPSEVRAKRPRLTRGDLTLRCAAVVVVAGVAVNVALANPRVANTLVLATTRQPDKFSELYFNESWQLPKTVTAGTPVTFSYHVSNLEGKGSFYQPLATLVASGTTGVISRNQFFLSNGQGKDVTVQFTPLVPNQTLEIIVTLPAQNESIHFWSQS